MKPFLIVFQEAVVVGVALIFFTYVAGYFTKMLNLKPTLPDICKTWNENRVMEITVFLAGFMFHIVFEWMGWNAWYAKDYIKYK